MGCGSSNTKTAFKKEKSLFNLDQKNLINESLLDEYTKDERINILSNAKKLHHFYDICEFSENVELANLTFVDASFFNFIAKISENKKMHTMFLKNVEFEGIKNKIKSCKKDYEILFCFNILTSKNSVILIKNNLVY